MPTSTISHHPQHNQKQQQRYSNNSADGTNATTTASTQSSHGLKGLSPVSLKAFFQEKLRRLKNFDSGFFSINGGTTPPSVRPSADIAEISSQQQPPQVAVSQKTLPVSLPPAVRVCELARAETLPSQHSTAPTIPPNGPRQLLETKLSMDSIAEESLEEAEIDNIPTVLKKSPLVKCLSMVDQQDQLADIVASKQNDPDCIQTATEVDLPSEEGSKHSLGRRWAGWWLHNTSSSDVKQQSTGRLSALLSRKLKLKSKSSTSLVSSNESCRNTSIPGSPVTAAVSDKPIERTLANTAHPVIKVPGPLPPAVQATIQLTTKPSHCTASSSKSSKNSGERDDDQYKSARRQDIIGVLRGQAQLPQGFADKYEILALLGDGAFGYVFAAKLRHSTAYDAEVAVKFIDKASVPSRSWVNDDQYGYIPFEAHFLKQINHPNIIRFLDLYTDSKYVYLVTDLHGTEWRSDNPLLNPIQNSGLRNVHGVQSAGKSALMATQDFSRLSDDELLERKRTACDLFECIDAHQRMPEDTVKFIFAQILDAVCYLADLGFVHRDLKDENIVIDQQYRIKLIDFGSCSRIPAQGDELNYFDSFNGTLHFASPEILMGKLFRGPEAEVWALGVLLYTLVYSENPFANTETILENRVRYRSRHEDANQLIRLMFEPEPEKRIKLTAIKRHPWICKYFLHRRT